jgi:predicted amidophosphoribosyltransferase
LDKIAAAFPEQIFQFQKAPTASGFNWVTIIESISETDVENLNKVLHLFSRTLSIDSPLDECFALDWHSRSGKIGKPELTLLGKWVQRAKSYGLEPESDGDLDVAAAIAEQMISFIERFPLYHNSDGIVTALPSNPQKSFDLPATIAELIVGKTKIPYLKEALYKKRITAQMKYCPTLDDKKDNIRDSIGANRFTVEAKRLILLDDIFDSGLTLFETAKALWSAGARTVYGLSVTKTLKKNFS